MSRTRKALLGVVTSFFSYFVLIVIQIFLSPLILKRYGQETLGLYAAVMQMIGFLTILDSALSVTFNRYLAQAFGSQNQDDLPRVFFTARVMTTSVGLINALFLLLAILFAPVLFQGSENLRSDLNLAILLLAGASIVKSPLSVYAIFLNAGQQMAFLNTVNISAGLIRACLVLSLVAFDWGISGVVLGTVLSEILGSVACYLFFLKKFQLARPNGWTVEKVFLKQVALFAKNSLLIQVLDRIRFQADTLLVGVFLDLATASVFYSSTTPPMMCFTLANLLMSNTLPGINEIIGRGDVEKVKSVYLRVFRLVLLLCLGSTIGIILFNKFVVSIWVGEGQYGGRLLDLLIAFQVGLLVLNSFNGNFLVAMGRVKSIARASSAVTLGGLILSICLVKTFGMIGLLITSVLVLLFGSFFLFWQIENLFGQKIYRSITTYFPR